MLEFVVLIELISIFPTHFCLFGLVIPFNNVVYGLLLTLETVAVQDCPPKLVSRNLVPP